MDAAGMMLIVLSTDHQHYGWVSPESRSVAPLLALVEVRTPSVEKDGFHRS
jgi:hypothetical protein